MYMNDGNKTKINLRNKSVFITGVAGFIGSNLAKRLLSTVEGVKVVGLDNMNHYYDVRLKEARLNELEQFDNFSFVKGNLADKAVIESIFEQYKPEIVVNLGAQAGVRYSITNPDAYVEANLIGFYNILEACRHSYDEGHTPVEHLVYAKRKNLLMGSNPIIAPDSEMLWNAAIVWRILRRYEYTGALVMGRRKKIDVNTTSVRTLPEDKWIIAENAHEAIVTKDEYYQAQKAIRNVTPIQYKVDDDFALKGKICCGNCNRQLRHERQYGEMVFYCGYTVHSGVAGSKWSGSRKRPSV